MFQLWTMKVSVVGIYSSTMNAMSFFSWHLAAFPLLSLLAGNLDLNIQIADVQITSFGCQKGDCYNGYGAFVYQSGDRYIGYFKEGKPHGNGIMYYSNKNKYIGSWQQSDKEGTGRFVFVEGDEYLGGFHKNQFHGFGVMHFSNGDRYEGQWQFNFPEGHGKFFYQEGNWFEGMFSKGRFQGEGTMHYLDGSHYKGLWKDSRKHGNGVLHLASGQTIKERWQNGELEGSGKSKTEESMPNPGIYRPEPTASLDNPQSQGPIKIWALVVGVAAYSSMPSLRYTDDDAYQYYAFLKSPEGGALPDSQIQLLIDETATRDNILLALKTISAKAGQNDAVLFYFSGHGLDGSFVPVDFDGLRNRISHEEIRHILASARARHKLVFGDACHSGSLYGMIQEGEMLAARSSDQMLQRFYKAFEDSEGGMALLLSSKSKEVSLEDSGLRSGVFSYFLIKGLKGMADANKDGLVTITELALFVQSKVKSYTAGAQTPVLLGQFDISMPVGVIRNTSLNRP